MLIYMKRGIKTGGRKPGVPNKITGELRKMMEEFVVGNFAGFTQAWLSIEDPKDRADIYIKTAKFVIPALQSVDVSGSLKTDKSIEQQLLELSKKK